MWVRKGCRGTFSCAGVHTQCGDWRGNPESVCACEQVFEQRHHTSLRHATGRAPPASLSLLIVVVASSTDTTQRRLLANMEYIESTHSAHRAHVDFAAVVYDDMAVRWNRTRALAASKRLRATRLLTVLDASSGHAAPLSTGARKARLVHQLLVLRATLSPTHDAVWLPDDDLSFLGFDLAEYLHRSGHPTLSANPKPASSKAPRLRPHVIATPPLIHEP